MGPILVAGGAGFIGSTFCHVAVGRGLPMRNCDYGRYLLSLVKEAG